MHFCKYLRRQKQQGPHAPAQLRLPRRRHPRHPHGNRAGSRVSVLEQALRPEDLYSADEVFISSTNRNLISVGEIAGNKIPIPVRSAIASTIFSNAYVADYVSRA